MIRRVFLIVVPVLLFTAESFLPAHAETGRDNDPTQLTGDSALAERNAFRIDSLRLISPRIVASIPPLASCQDITDNCASAFGGCVFDSINDQIQTALDPVSAGGDYSVHIVEIFEPLDPSAEITAAEIYMNAVCTEGAGPDSCEPPAGIPDIIFTTVSNSSVGTCYVPDPGEVNTSSGIPAAYSPTVNTVSAPCYSISTPTITIPVAGADIVLEDVTIAATYSGVPPDRFVSGVLTGFISDDDAAATYLPVDFPLFGGSSLYSFLQGADQSVNGVPDSCNLSGGVHEDDSDLFNLNRGFRFYLNFGSESVSWPDIANVADLSVTKTDNQEIFRSGEPVTYTITVSNAGPVGVIGASVQDILPDELSQAQWVCTPGNGATCSASGDGDISDLVDIPNGSSVSYTLTAETDLNYFGDVTNTVTVTAPLNVDDPNPDNDTATDISLSQTLFTDGFEGE